MVYDKRKGIEVKVKLSKKEVLSQKRTYANYLNFLSKILIEKGDYTKADSIIDITSQWILSLIGEGDIVYVDNLYLKGLTAYNRQDYPTAIHFFDEAYHNLGKQKNGLYYLPSSEKYRLLIYKLLEVSALVNYEEQTNAYGNEYQSYIKRTFDKESIFYCNADLLDVYIRIGRLDFIGAEKYIEKILTTQVNLKGSLKQIEVLTLASQVYFENNKIEQGINALAEIDKQQEKIHGLKHPISALNQLTQASENFKHGNDHKQLLQTFNQYYPQYLQEFGVEHIKYTTFNLDYSELLLLNDEYEKATKNIESCISLLAETYGKNSVQVGNHYTLQGIMALKWGDFLKATKCLNSSKVIFELEANKSSFEAIDFFVFAGKYYTLQGEFDIAKKYYKQVTNNFNSIEKNKKRKQKRVVDQSLFSDLQLEKGNFSSIQKEVSITLAKYEKVYGPTHTKLIIPIKQLIEVSIQTGDYSNATRLLQRLNGITSEHFGKSSLTHNSNLVFDVHLNSELGDFKTAEKYLKQLIEVQEKYYQKSLNINLITSQTDLALIELALGNKSADILTQLETAASSILKLFENNPTPLYAEALKKIATYHLENNSPEKALATIAKIENEIYPKINIGKNHPKIAVLNTLKGQIYNHQNKFDLALEEYTAASIKYKKSFSENHPLYIECLSAMAQIHYAQNNFTKTTELLSTTTNFYLSFIDNYFPWLTENEKNSYWTKIKSEFEFFNSIAVDQSKSNPELVEKIFNYTLHTKALLLNSNIQLRRVINTTNDTTLINDFNSWVNLREKYTAQLGVSDIVLKEQGEPTRQELENQIRLLEKSISSKSADFTKQYTTTKSNTATWKDIQTSLTANQYVVDIIRYRHFDRHFTDSIVYAALILSKTSITPELVVLPNGSELESRYIYYYRNSTRFEFEDSISYTYFWKPIKEKIKDKAEIFLVNDGVYSQINIEALKIDSTYAIDKNNIILILNPKDLIRNNTSSYSSPIKTGDATLICNPLFYSKPVKKETTIALPGTAEEVNSIAEKLKTKGWKTTIYGSKEASEKNLKSVSSPRILHIATHGFFIHDEAEQNTSFSSEVSETKQSLNPLLKSGLLLANSGDLFEEMEGNNFNIKDGVLTAYETIGLDLHNTEMVVLSACETGLGEIHIGEGVYGLQRAFTIAGSKILVMSLFKVADKPTQILIDLFYQNLIKGLDKRTAFTNAKLELRKTHPETVHWGSFIMMGID